MAYTKQDWKNLPDQSTPISAARLNHLETQYEEGVAYTDEKIALNPGPQGPEGAPGPQGPEGPEGPRGPAGADGVPGADGADGPQGAQGPSGDPGATGPAGVISSASVTGLPPSTAPTISMGGTPSDRTFTFGIPKGEQGEPGADGTSVNVLGTLPGVGSLPASGEAGDAYIIAGNLWVWSANSNDWTNAGPFQGPKGDTGTAGASATITSATATSLNPADAPTVVLGGSPSARTFAFGIPKGAPGAAGADGAAGTISSATATGLAAGAAPTVTLGGTPSSRTLAFGIPKGDKGDKGTDGTNGTNGSDGAPGAAGTITSASASGLAPGASPTVTLGGTPNERTMAFGIPAGAKGEQGTPTTVNGKTGASITLTAADVGADTSAAVDAKVKNAPIPAARIKHVEATGYNYEVIRVTGGRDSIRKIQPKATASNGTLPTAGMLTPKQMAAESGYMNLTNCEAFGGSTLKRIVGLHIIDGVAVQNFGVQSDGQPGSNLEALVLQNDGTLKAVRASDGKTAAQYVAEGAYSSFGYGPILVENGLTTSWWNDARFAFYTNNLSARTMIGQAANGDYIIVTVEGKSDSYGIKGSTLSQIMLNEGCVIAVNLDGGGTTQTMWSGEVVHPSSDATGVRSSMSYLAICAPASNEYDSGEIAIPVVSGVTSVSGLPPVSVRQRGAMVSLRFTMAVAIPVDAWVTITSTPIPQRYIAENADFNRGVLYGTSGAAVGISIGNLEVPNISIRNRSYTGALGSAAGTLTYRAQFA